MSVPATRAQAPAADDKLPDGAMLRLGSPHLRHQRTTHDVALSPDGKLIASTGDEGMLCLWDAATGKRLWMIPRQKNGGIIAVVFSHDSKLLVYRDGNTVCVWDVAKREARFVLPNNPGYILQPAFAPDDQLLAVPCQGGLVRVFDTVTGNLRHELVCANPPRAVVFLPGGKTLVSCERYAVLRFWDVASGKELRRIELQDDEYAVAGFAVSPDGKWLAVTESLSISRTGNRNLPIHFRMIDIAAGKELYRLPSTEVFAWRVVFAPDGKTVVRGLHHLGDIALARIEVLEAATGKVMGSVGVPGGGVQGLSFTADGRTLASTGSDFAVRLWSFPDLKPRLPPVGHVGQVSALAYAADGKLLCSGGEDRTIVFWDLGTGQPRHVWPNHPGTPRDLGVCADGKHFISAVNNRDAFRNPTDGTAFVYRVATGEQVHKWGPVRGGVALSPDGKTMAAGDTDNNVRLWNVATGALVRTCSAHKDAIDAIAFSPDGLWLASASRDGTVRLWWSATGLLHRTLDLAKAGPRSLAFTADGLFLVVGCDGAAVQIWEVMSGKRHQYVHMKPPVHDVTYLAGGRTILAAGRTGGPEIFDAVLDKRLAVVPSPGPRIQVTAIASDAKTFATGAEDGLVLVWKTSSFLGPQPKPVSLTAQQLADLWTDLGKSGTTSYQAFWALAGGDRDTVAFLGAKLGPVRGPDAKQLAQRIADLDSNSFKLREQATRQLEAWGPAVEFALRQVLEGKPTMEVRQRIEALLAKLDTQMNEEVELRALRAMGVLEAIGTSEARKLLAHLATGAPGSRITAAAQRALERLNKTP
jgi:WD40 repeat protein